MFEQLRLLSKTQIFLLTLLAISTVSSLVSLYFSIVEYIRKQEANQQLRAMGAGEVLPETLLGESMFGIFGSVLFVIVFIVMSWLVWNAQKSLESSARQVMRQLF
jgi:hypothetical protein